MKKESCFKEYAKYTSLNIIGMVGLSCYILADTFFISKGLGANGLAALNLAIPIYSFIHGSGLMFGMGGATRYSIFKGQKAWNNSDHVFTNTIYAVAVLAALFVLTGIFFSEKITTLLGADAAIFDMTNIYLKVILLFAPVFMLNNVFICFVRNDGNPRLAMIAMLGGSFSNIILDYIFIFPFHMGILGAVLATGAAPVISMLLLSRHKWKKLNQFHFKWTMPDILMIVTNLSLGFPSLVTEVSSGVVIIVFNMIILGLNGTIGVAAYGVIANLSLVVSSIYTGIAQGIQPIISKAYGEGNQCQTKQILRYGMVTMILFSAFIYGIMFGCADPITSIFNSEHNAELQKIAVFGMKLYFMAVPFVGFNIVISSFFTSTEQAIPAQFISIIRGFLLIIPMAFCLSYFMEIIGVWLAFPVTELIVSIMGMIFYDKKYGRLDKKREIQIHK